MLRDSPVHRSRDVHQANPASCKRSSGSSDRSAPTSPEERQRTARAEIEMERDGTMRGFESLSAHEISAAAR